MLLSLPRHDHMPSSVARKRCSSSSTKDLRLLKATLSAYCWAASLCCCSPVDHCSVAIQALLFDCPLKSQKTDIRHPSPSQIPVNPCYDQDWSCCCPRMKQSPSRDSSRLAQRGSPLHVRKGLSRPERRALLTGQAMELPTWEDQTSPAAGLGCCQYYFRRCASERGGHSGSK